MPKRKLKPVEADDGTYGGAVLAAFDAMTLEDAAPQPGDFVSYGSGAEAPKGRLLRIDNFGQAIVFCTDGREMVLSYGRLVKLQKR